MKTMKKRVTAKIVLNENVLNNITTEYVFRGREKLPYKKFRAIFEELGYDIPKVKTVADMVEKMTAIELHILNSDEWAEIKRFDYFTYKNQLLKVRLFIKHYKKW